MATKAIHRIPFAVDSDGNAKSIDEVDRGKNCLCFCPECKAPLIARKGERRLKVWHFAHEPGSSCAGALESSIHLAVKEVISKCKCLLVPRCNVFRYPDDQIHLLEKPVALGEFTADHFRYSPSANDYSAWAHDVGAGVAAFPASSQLIEFDEVLVEKTEGNIRPDIIGIKGNKRIFVEVAITHYIDQEKLNRIRARKTAAIEISVPFGDKALGWEEIKKIVVEQPYDKYWAFNPRAEELAEEDYKKKERYRIQLKQDAERKRELEAQRIAAARLIAQQKAAEKHRQYEEMVERENKATRERFLEQQAENERIKREREEESALQSILYEQQAAETRVRQREQELKEKQEIEEEQKRRTESLQLLRSGKPSPLIPPSGIVIFLDLDRMLQTRGQRNTKSLENLAAALAERFCDIVVTSEIRHKEPWESIAERLSILGGRHLGFTPVLDRSDPYGNRQREIDAWRRGNICRKAFVIDGSSIGLEGALISLNHRTGFTDENAKAVKQWLG